MRGERYLLDVNVLISLTDEDHAHHGLVSAWFHEAGPRDWGVCALTEAGFLRVSSNPRAGGKTVGEATEMLRRLASQPGYRYWSLGQSWISLTERFSPRVFGHQQVNDAILLGLAVREGGVLVTMDKGIQYMAGAGLGRHVLVLG